MEERDRGGSGAGRCAVVVPHESAAVGEDRAPPRAPTPVLLLPPVQQERSCRSCPPRVPPSDHAPVHQANQTTVYNGVYKLRTVEESDLCEVLLYWSRLVTAAVSLVAVASAVFLLEGNDAVRQGIDLLYAASAAGIVLSTCHCSSSTSMSCQPQSSASSRLRCGLLGCLASL